MYPLISDIRVKIAGNIDDVFALLAPGVYTRYRDMFLGRVDDVRECYDNAAAILLPTIAGHGLSIKTIEAMATGAQLVATPGAFRGINVDATKLDNVRFAEDPIEFARHIRELENLVLKEAPSGIEMTDRHPCGGSDKRRQRNTAATKKMFDKLFSFEQYIGGIALIANLLLNNPVVAHAAASDID